jgi:signal transduction histidine kinase
MIKKYLFVFLLVVPLTIIAQQNDIFILSSGIVKHSKTANGWIALDSGWRFKTGDNADWANTNFNDSSWEQIHLLQDFYSLPQIPKNGVVWFRLRIKNDSTFKQPLVMRLYQTGASEIYLDGKLVHTFGNISSHPDSIKYFNPASKNFSFPLLNNTEQILAVRFANLPNRYPVYFNNAKSFLQIWVTTADNAEADYIANYLKTFTNRTHVALGVALLLSVLYLSFYFFFPAVKINLWFSLCNFSFSLYLIFELILSNYHGALHILDIPETACLMFYLLVFLYCIYKIFNQKPKLIYKVLLVVGILCVPLVFIINASLVNIFLALLILADTLRISIKSLHAHKTGARIILICVAIDFVYWTLNFLSSLFIINIPGIDTYNPFALLIAPLGLAIYLGYDFGKTSQSLRQKLAEVEQLSSEKQQILSNQNELLEQQVSERTAELNQSLHELKSTQQQLIQSEKMASLGELTAGIAHEIQNPLNFVNNFSEVNIELTNEMNDENDIEEIKAIANDIKQNSEKILLHGRRADAIVKSMLQHSKQTKGIKEPTDINALCDEYLRLSFHGMRAKDKSFNADFKTEFDNTIGKINIVPQDIGRVLLNLFNNAFYAVNEKMKTADENYKPLVTVRTLKNPPPGGRGAEIIVSDNGNGIPPNIIDKIFQPFFTTKPTGEGTGLGLSLAYEIITKEHNGTIKVESREGEGTTFVINLPVV